jgi:hypothetical protein
MSAHVQLRPHGYGHGVSPMSYLASPLASISFPCQCHFPETGDGMHLTNADQCSMDRIVPESFPWEHTDEGPEYVYPLPFPYSSSLPLVPYTRYHLCSMLHISLSCATCTITYTHTPPP